MSFEVQRPDNVDRDDAYAVLYFVAICGSSSLELSGEFVRLHIFLRLHKLQSRFCV